MQLVILLFAVVSFGISAKAVPLNVSVYYESLCPDSIKFITTQLYPTYQLIPSELNIQLVPFGNAKIANLSDGTLNLTCQHGPDECYGNEIQACAIFFDLKDSIDFVNCAMASDDPSGDTFLSQCANSSDMSWIRIKQCVDSGLGDDLFVQNGNLTPDFINYVPTIIFNGVYNDTLQEQGEKEFLKTVCVLLGQEPNCASYL